MKKEEFIRFIKEIGIVDIEEFRIYIGSLCKTQYSRGVYMDQGEWIVYSVDERNNCQIRYKGAENIAFDKIFITLMAGLYIIVSMKLMKNMKNF